MTQVEPLIQGILEAHGAPKPSTEWRERELGLAHRLIEDVRNRGWHPETDAHRLLSDAMEAIEAADVEIELSIGRLRSA
jgi:hypothetical protein